MARHIEDHYGKPDVIAGVATGAIGIGALVADYLNLPFVYVRPEPKKHGRQNQVEGMLESGSNVVGIEDLISTGKSSLSIQFKNSLIRQTNRLISDAIILYAFNRRTKGESISQCCLTKRQ